ncbi:GAF domain-containing protein [Cellulomonas endometrii]|jgi:hypothetical protein|uniref:GAF domain-containing protein n=1 Tax=Cellulomonas endometrii TaxID=3036301 RepID=UPI0024AE8287|nr:GAF domain-containing protein [Cellulomonas endometrii]
MTTTTYLQRHADGAAAGMGAGAHASITFRHLGATVRAASSSARVARCDDEDAAGLDGPSALAMRGMRTVVLPDLLAEARWPSWRGRLRAEHFASFVVVPVSLGDRAEIAVAFYAVGLRDWQGEDLATAGVLAEAIAADVRGHLALADLDARTWAPRFGAHARELHAVGVLMEARGLGAGAAEELLRAVAARTGADVAQVGAWVTAGATGARGRRGPAACA